MLFHILFSFLYFFLSKQKQNSGFITLQKKIHLVRLEKRKKIQELKSKLSPLNIDTLKKFNAPFMRKVGPIPGSDSETSVLNALQEANRRRASSNMSASPEPHLLAAPNGRGEQYTPSPSPEPIEYDTEIDPDNMIIRGASDNEDHYEYDDEGRIILKPEN